MPNNNSGQHIIVSEIQIAGVQYVDTSSSARLLHCGHQNSSKAEFQELLPVATWPKRKDVIHCIHTED